MFMCIVWWISYVCLLLPFLLKHTFCLRIVVFNTFCVVFCFSTSCASYASSFSGLYFFESWMPLRYSLTYISLHDICIAVCYFMVIVLLVLNTVANEFFSLSNVLFIPCGHAKSIHMFPIVCYSLLSSLLYANSISNICIIF